MSPGVEGGGVLGAANGFAPLEGSGAGGGFVFPVGFGCQGFAGGVVGGVSIKVNWLIS